MNHETLIIFSEAFKHHEYSKAFACISIQSIAMLFIVHHQHRRHHHRHHHYPQS